MSPKNRRSLFPSDRRSARWSASLLLVFRALTATSTRVGSYFGPSRAFTSAKANANECANGRRASLERKQTLLRIVQGSRNYLKMIVESIMCGSSPSAAFLSIPQALAHSPCVIPRLLDSDPKMKTSFLSRGAPPCGDSGIRVTSNRQPQTSGRWGVTSNLNSLIRKEN